MKYYQTKIMWHIIMDCWISPQWFARREHQNVILVKYEIFAFIKQTKWRLHKILENSVHFTLNAG